MQTCACVHVMTRGGRGRQHLVRGRAREVGPSDRQWHEDTWGVSDGVQMQVCLVQVTAGALQAGGLTCLLPSCLSPLQACLASAPLSTVNIPPAQNRSENEVRRAVYSGEHSGRVAY